MLNYEIFYGFDNIVDIDMDVYVVILLDTFVDSFIC